MKQTAVEFLIEQLSNYDSKMIELFGKEINQAKEMFEKQIIDACRNFGNLNGVDIEDYNRYYNDTFNETAE